MFRLGRKSFLSAIVCLYLAVPSNEVSASAARNNSTKHELITGAIDGGRLLQARAMLAKLGYDYQSTENPHIAMVIGKLALAEQKNELAAKIFEQHIGETAVLCRANEGAGIAATRRDEMKKAVKYLLQATSKCPERWTSWNAMGVALSSFRKWDASQFAFNQALLLSNRDPIALNNTGFMKLLAGHPGQALTYFTEALDQDPGNVKFQNNVDIAVGASGNVPKRRARESEDRWAERLSNSGRAAILSGKTDIGRSLLATATLSAATYSLKTASNWTAEPKSVPSE